MTSNGVSAPAAADMHVDLGKPTVEAGPGMMERPLESSATG